MILTLPFPPEHCWPNARSRSHWPKTRDLKAAKKLAWEHSLEWRNQFPSGNRFIIQITCFPKPRGPAPDGDNINASAKAYIDGIASAMGVNDRHFAILPAIIGAQRTATFHISVTGVTS